MPPQTFSFRRLPQTLRALLHGETLKLRSFRSAGWTISSFGLQYSLRLISTLVLTRLLTPDAFGLMSLAGIILSGLALISDIGTTPSIIRSTRGNDPAFLQTAWTLQVIRGAIICVGACLLAWPLSVFYDEPLLFPIVVALSITALLEGMTSVSIPIAQRQMALGKLTFLEVLVQAVTLMITIIIAWQYRSVWAVVVGALIGSVLRLVLSHLILPPFKHGLRWEKETLTEIIVFGRWVLLGTFLTFLGGNGIRAIEGTLVPLDILGMLTIAATISWALGDLVGKLLGNIAFPALSEIIRERPHDAAASVRRIQLALIAGGLPGFLLLSFIAQDMISLMYDDRYAKAGTFLMLMAIGSAGGTLSMPYQNAMLAMGNSRSHALVMGCGAILKILGVIVGYHFGGVIWMITGAGIANCIVLGLSSTLAHRWSIANLPLDIAGVTVVLVAFTIALNSIQPL